MNYKDWTFGQLMVFVLIGLIFLLGLMGAAFFKAPGALALAGIGIIAVGAAYGISTTM